MRLGVTPDPIRFIRGVVKPEPNNKVSGDKAKNGECVIKHEHLLRK
jgi:hypothetical protein